MDRNGILILVVAGLLFFLWPSMVDNLFPPPPAPPPSAGEGNATTAPEGNKTVGNQNKPGQNNSTAPAGNNASVPVGNATQPGGNQTIRPTPVFHGVQAADSNDTLVMESNDTDVHFIRQGGGISVFRLNGHIANITEEPSNATAERRVGLNLGANKDSADRAQDFAQVLAHCGPNIDFATVNVSSPNTEKLRDLQGKDALSALLQWRHRVARRHSC